MLAIKESLPKVKRKPFQRSLDAVLAGTYVYSPPPPLSIAHPTGQPADVSPTPSDRAAASAEPTGPASFPKKKKKNDTVNLEDMITKLDPETKAMLDALHARAEASDDPATILMRGVPAGSVCAEWSETEALARTSKFWASNSGKFTDYALSKNVTHATRFVTHSWAPPKDWVEHMGKHAHYGTLKAAELAMVSRDLAEELGVDEDKWRDELTFWIDKVSQRTSSNAPWRDHLVITTTPLTPASSRFQPPPPPPARVRPPHPARPASRSSTSC